jgi:hypothetical protein
MSELLRDQSGSELARKITEHFTSSPEMLAEPLMEEEAIARCR